MSAPAPYICKCETTDSALSLTANAISIVTLAYVLLLGIGYRAAVYQRARDRVSSYHADAKALRRQINTATNSVMAVATEEPILKEILNAADNQLSELEIKLLKDAETDAIDDKWYLIWRQVKYSRKREERIASLAVIKSQVDLYINYQ
jgi:hypothetical protein